MIERTFLSRDIKKTIRVFLVQDPSVEVFIKTTEVGVRAKLKGIRKDISYQKFPRWVPFKNQGQGNRDRNVHGWDWEFVE